MNAWIRFSVVWVWIGMLPTSPAIAQCGAGAEFATIGGGPTAEKLRVEIDGAFNQGAEVGRFWNPHDSNQGNNFSGGCPSNDTTQTYGAWWKESGGTELRGIRGVRGGSNCAASSCPNSDLLLLVEDWGSAGPPGVGDTAYFIAMRVAPDTPGSAFNRQWDYALVDNPANGGESPTVVGMLEFPRPQVVAAGGAGGGEFVVTLDYPDVAANVHALDVDGNTLPASSIVSGYRLYSFQTFGGSEPGRSADAWGEPIDQRPYQDGPASAEVVLSFPPPGARIYLALGLDFVGGSGPDVGSVLVGASVSIETGLPGIPAPAGAAPDGKDVPGDPLRIAKSQVADAPLLMSWGSSCLTSDFDYEIYEGTLGDFTSHAPVTCSTSGELSYGLLPTGGDRYYLVVPVSPPDGQGAIPAEGSYGRTSAGGERAQNPLAACRGQSIGGCP